MTHQEINEMKTGREIDTLIALHVMQESADGYSDPGAGGGHGDPGGYSLGPRPYSSNIAQAWRVIEKMRELHMAHDWENAFVELTCWKWFLLSTDAFCLGACRAALKIAFDPEGKPNDS